MSNNWNQQPTNNQGGGTPSPRSGGLLKNYQHQRPPTPPQGPNGSHVPSPQPQVPQMSQGPMSSQQGRQQQPAGPQGWAANTMQVMRQWSGKMVSVYGHGQGYSNQPAPAPLERYRPPTPSGPLPPARPKPWKRSRSLRIAQMRRERRNNTGFSAGRIWAGIAIAIALFIVIFGSSGSAYAYSFYQSQQPKLQGIANQHIPQAARIYDRNGVLLTEKYDPNADNGGHRVPVTFKDIPQVLKDAMTSAEDPTFWTNTGFDPQGILRAATSGGGASTLTQQLIKNLTNQKQNSYQRKVSEISLSIGLTQQYPKAKIMEMYFNVSGFDISDLGVEAAFEKYFGIKPQCDQNFNCPPAITKLNYDPNTNKDVPLLGLARASLLAGIPQSPNHYDPTREGVDPFPINLDSPATYKQEALARQHYVLTQMMKYNVSVDGLGPITSDIAQQVEALTAKMTFQAPPLTRRAPHFVEWVKDQVVEALGGGQAGLYAFLTGGFNIRTTIDVNLEQYVEDAAKRHLTQPERQKFLGGYGPLNKTNNVNDSAVVVMDAKTGEVLAMNGSTDFNDQNPKVNGQFNAATAGRQPGSTFKPFEYATAFQMGWYPGLVLPDFKTYFPGGSSAGANIKDLYSPPDYGNTYHNLASTIRLATANSFNVPAVKAMAFASMDNVVANAKRMGVTSFNGCNQPRILSCFPQPTALGTQEIPLIEMTGAYQTFANNGVHVPPQSVLDIWDNYGHHLYHFDPAKVRGTPVFSPQVSFMMTDVLKDEPSRALEFSTDHDLSFGDWDAACISNRECAHQVAAKTGTTDNFSDNWTMGYTTNVVVGVWTGNADGNKDPMINVVGITGAAPIWHSVMERLERGPDYCNSSQGKVDAIASCTGNFNYNFTKHTFDQPGGLKCVSTSPLDGLQGSGGACDWMIDGTQPQQKGVIPNPVDPNAPPTPPTGG